MKRILIVLVCVLAVMTATARADIVVRDDDQRFEGEIVAENADAVSIDTVIATVRTTLKVPRSEVKSIEKKPVPPGFFEPPPAPSRISDPKAFGAQDTLYLEVPIVGKFGEAVYADGVAQVLAYAKRNRVRHVVFNIDSTGWNNIDEAGDVYRAMKKYQPDITYHALIRNCLGDALAVALMCDTVNLLPGAKVGGAPGNLTDASKTREAEDEEVLRRQIAEDVVNHMRERGKPGTVVRAMIDPVDPLAVWRNKEGAIVSGSAPPEDLPADRLIIRNAPGEVLVLLHDQLIKLGMPAFDGKTSDLGKVLNLPNWRLESDYGRKALTDIVAAKQKVVRFDTAVKTNISRRETTGRAFQHNLQMAAQYDPSKATYGMQSHHGWGWGWGGGDGSGESNLFTQESQQKWQRLTDTCMMYLQRAAQAALAMKRLDEEAVKLGLEPTYKPGDLALTAQDMETRYNTLKAERDKRGK